MNMAEFNTFGRREKALIIQAQREHGHISFGQSQGHVGDRHYRELYVFVKMWTPAVLIVDFENRELWDALSEQVEAFATEVRRYYRAAEDELIAKFDELVKGEADK